MATPSASGPADWDARRDAFTFAYTHPLHAATTGFIVKAIPMGATMVINAVSSAEGASPFHTVIGVDAEAENVTLEELIKKIKKAASAQLLYSEDPQCASTVHFWSNQVLAALKAPATPGASAAGAGAPGESHQKTQLIKKHFAGFLVRLMYGAGATVTSSTSPQCWRAWNLSAAWRQLPSVR